MRSVIVIVTLATALASPAIAHQPAKDKPGAPCASPSYAAPDPTPGQDPDSRIRLQLKRDSESANY